MESPWLNRLKQFVENKPIVVLRFGPGEWESLRESRRGLNEFTIARPHALLEAVRIPVACLLYGSIDDGEGLYFGLISSRSAVTTLDSRIKVRRSVQIQPKSEPELVRLISDEPHKRNLRDKLRGSSTVIILSPKLSNYIICRLASITFNHGPMRAVAESLSAPKYFRDAAALQENAIHTALKVFGIAPSAPALSLELVEKRETALSRVGIMEDSVIEHDARHLPDYDLVKSDLTGRAVFEHAHERLEVFTANKRPLERVFGVDLIYLNTSRQNIVMLQYKMLEPLREGATDIDWLYRPDANLDSEICRMRKFTADHRPDPFEYRLNPSVFYLKLVKRNGLIRNGGIIIPIDHFEKLRLDPACRGPRNGLRVTYEALAGRYLRQNAFLDLVRSGYIGAHAATTIHLKSLVEAILCNDKAVVAAIQQRAEASPGDEADKIDDLDYLISGTLDP